VGVDFIPVVFETIGGIAVESVSIIRSIGRGISQRSSMDPDYSIATRQLFARLAITLWRGNAALWLHRLQPPPPLIDGVE
jgi:hypothetical protein